MRRSGRSASPGRRVTVAAGALALMAALLLSACGGSSKPAYCTDVANFKSAVGELKNVSSPSAVVDQAKKVASTGEAALAAVKTSFAPQTSAVKSSLAALENTAKQLTSSSTRASALAALPAEVQAVITAGENLAKAAQPKCG